MGSCCSTPDATNGAANTGSRRGGPARPTRAPAGRIVRVANLPELIATDKDVQRDSVLVLFQFSFAPPVEAQILPVDGEASSVAYVTFESEQHALMVVTYLGGDGISVVDRVPRR